LWQGDAGPSRSAEAVPSARRQEAREYHSRCLAPDSGQNPRTLPPIQYQAPDLDPTTKGAWNLGDDNRDLRDDKRHKKLEEFADQIALRVRDAADETPLPELKYQPKMGAVRSAFLPPALPLAEFDSPQAPAGPSVVTFVYASALPWSHWPWAPPEDRAILHLSAAVATGKEMQVNQLTFDPGDPSFVRRLDKARDRNNIVVMLVDADSLAADALCARMREYDQQRYSNLATVVIWNGNRQPESEKKVNEIFAGCSRHNSHFFHSVEDRTQFNETLSQTLDRLGHAVVNNPNEPNLILEPTAFRSLPTVTVLGRLQSE
jgi:hypothetical protein